VRFMSFAQISCLPFLLLQTEDIDGQKHEHSVVSKINLVDLAGSERQDLAKTSGDRLRVSISHSYRVVCHDHG